MTPTDRFVTANRLRHHLLDWGGGRSVVLLLHGFLEHAHAWDFVAPRLAAAGHRVLALDWRGHGDSEWIGAGGYYHFADYTADLAFLVRALGGRVALVGHSMGASAALVYAGTEPERVAALVAVDALGPPDAGPETAPARFAAWLAGLERVGRGARVAFAGDDPAARLRERFPRFSADVAAHMARHGTREHDGRRAWKFDPLHRTTTPQPYSRAQAAAFWRRIACPVLYVEGAESALRLDASDVADRLRVLRARRVTLPGSGHHPHLEVPDALAGVLVEFLAAGRWTNGRRSS
ncbi:MAG TPA: alpha/beta hydrolase [Candidatus Binatia bacterium]|jgi:pimeloyl-ACP methyl ester carboxylesterase|nr:alpha/beta hydrolase [Candidatus Binatia bacterium]